MHLATPDGENDMPLGEVFREQLRALEDFLRSSSTVVRRVLVDGEMRPVLLKMLAGREAEDDFTHIILAYQGPFVEPVSWFVGLQNLLESELKEHGAELTAEGVDIKDHANDPEARGPWPFLRRAERLAEELARVLGALAFLLEPTPLVDRAGYVKSMVFLAQKVRSRRLKFIALEDRKMPTLTELEGTDRVSSQIFWAAPQDLQARMAARLVDPGQTDPAERQQLLGMAAGFAFANRDYTKAEALQREQLALPGAQPLQRAVAHYGLGNTLLADGRAEPATATYLRACAVCNDHALHEFAPFAYTNLGVALHRLGRFDEAFRALRVASRAFRAQDNSPGEAFVCDNLAKMHLELGQENEAAKIWRYALRLYQGITNPALADVRKAGLSDLATKLDRVTVDA
jgi:tetratricopeptide (TPR) repeat protein